MELDAHLAQFQEVSQKFFPLRGEDAFGMKLDAPDGELFVAQTHDFAFWFCLRRDFEAGGQAFAADEERVITRGFERIAHARE